MTSREWSPYAAGACLGVLSWITFAFMGEALGTSTSMAAAAGMVEGWVAPDHLRQTSYLAHLTVTRPPVDWQMALDLLLPMGAFLAGWLGGGVRASHLPEVWRRRFGPSRPLRYLGAFAGGAIMLFGARLAGGCTSGHCISGGLQLALSSYVFTLALFASGIATAMLIYRRRRAQGEGEGGTAHV